jgi:hypothetical protein
MPRPNTNATALKRVLQEELLLARRLLEIAEQQTAALVANDVPTLSRLQIEQQRCVNQQNILTTERNAAVRDLAWGLGMDRVPTLRNLMPGLPAYEQGKLEQLRTQLLAIHGDIKRVHARNRVLLESALNYVRFSLEVLTSTALQPARYGANLTRIAAPAFYIDRRA